MAISRSALLFSEDLLGVDGRNNSVQENITSFSSD